MSDSDSNENVHELAYYTKDKVKLMKEVLRVLNPKKIKAMAPECIKHMDIGEINSMLLEELLGISNKRLQYIFKGENADRETSSSESDDEEKKMIDVISLDDISDDEDFDVCVASTSQKDCLKDGKGKSGKSTRKDQTKSTNDTKIKQEKKTKQKQSKKESEEDKLMSVLELLELQARARAIRSQLAIETENIKNADVESTKKIKEEHESDSDAIIVDSPQHNEIVITSESDGEDGNKTSKVDFDESSKKQKMDVPTMDQHNTNHISESELNLTKARLLSKLQKIRLNRNKNTNSASKTNTNSTTTDETNGQNSIDSKDAVKQIPNPNENDDSNKFELQKDTPSKTIAFCDNDEIVINLDEDEMDDIE